MGGSEDALCCGWAVFGRVRPAVALLAALRDARHPYGPRQHPLWRMHPERWLESLAVGDVSVLDERLVSSRLYSQVPAFSALDRAMIDVLTTTRDGRLAVVELKADEDIHLPMQGLDYWSRVECHHARGEFPPLWIFWWSAIVDREAAAVSSGAGIACASRYRSTAALHFARDQLGVRGD